MRAHVVGLLVALCACGDNLGSDHPPTLEDFDVSTPEDMAVTRTLAATDPENGQLTFTASDPAHGSATVNGAELTYTPDLNFNGTDTVMVTVSDGKNTATATVTVHVTPVNDAPTGGADTLNTLENTDLVTPIATLLANDTDVDGDTLTITSLGNVSQGTASIVGTDIHFTPTHNFSGDASFEYLLSDGNLTTTVTATVHVEAVDQAPTAVDDTATTDEDTALAIPTSALLANDTDPENATLTVTAVNNPTNGTVTLSGTTVTFTPAANFNGTAGFDYTISDGTNTATAHVTVTVTPVNDAPVAVDDTATTPEDTALTIAQATLLANDTDAENQMLGLTAVSNATNGTVAISGSNVVFTPAANFSGTAGFDYTVSDGTLTDVGHVTVTVTAVNDAPVAVADAATTPEDTVLTIAKATLLANDTDADGDTLTLTAVSNPTNGTVAISGTNVVFTPAPNFNGTAGFDYTVSDGSLTAVGHVTVTVTPVNDAPVAVNDTATTAEDTALTIAKATLLANDTDPENQTLTLTAVSNATNGTVVISGSNVVFTPATNFNGTAGFDYTVSDGTLTSVAHVTVTVTAVNDAPVAVDDAVNGVEDIQLTIPTATLLGNDTDVDGPTLTITSVSNPTHGTVMLVGANVIFTPVANYNGPATFEYTVSDGTLTDIGLVTITFAPVNDAPVAVDDSVNGTEDTALDIPASTLLANDSDVDGQTLTVSAVSNATHGTVTLSGTTVHFVPAANYNGPATFKYTVTDGSLSATATVTINLAPVNDPPTAVADFTSTSANTPKLIPAATLLANDTDIDGDTLTVTAVQNAVHGSVTLVGTTVTFTPEIGYVGTASFEYVVSDGTLTAVGLVTVDIGGSCGDGVLSGSEQCDDGNTTAGDGCNPACAVESGWNCSGAPSSCTTTCGDGITAGTEQCDDSNTAAGDGCGPTCQTEICGDGIVNNNNTEQCDDGNNVETDGCTTSCTTAVVCDATAFPGGDRFAVDPVTGHCYVSFDDDQTTYGDAESACAADGGYLVTITSLDEDNLVRTVQNAAQNPWIGATDDSNDTDDVFNWVTGETWSYRHFVSGEPDDDAGFGGQGECLHIQDSSGGWADTNCNFSGFVTGRICEVELEACGDGVVEAGETCDDGNTTSNDGCSATCVAEVCGDGIQQPGEQCDDGNTTSGDGCSATCKIEGCGDGIVQTGEACDDGNTNNFDGCSATCTVEQGAVCSGTAPTTCSKLVINEINYDTPGTDNSGGSFEFVEIYNAGTAAANLNSVALILENGGTTPASEYFFDGTTGAANVGKRILLTAANVPGNALPPGGFIVVGPSGVTSTVPMGVFTITLVAPSAGIIQNGAPDAIALFNLASSTMIDALAYEGPVTNGTITGVTGNFNFTEGTSTTLNPSDSGATPDQSLVRTGPNAKDQNNNLTDFTLATPSPGLPN